MFGVPSSFVRSLLVRTLLRKFRIIPSYKIKIKVDFCTYPPPSLGDAERLLAFSPEDCSFDVNFSDGRRDKPINAIGWSIPQS